MELIDFLTIASAILFGLFALAFITFSIVYWLTERRMSDGRNLLDEFRERWARR